MNEKDSLKGVKYTFEKKQKSKPKINQFFMGVISGFLALLGIMIIVMVAMGAKNPFAVALATETPTPTSTFTLMPTATFTETPTLGPTATLTPSGPQSYIVKENDTCWDIAQAFDVDINVLIALNFPDGNCNLIPGVAITIPGQDAELPTATPFPTDFPRGGEFIYTVQLGDTLVSIADKFNDDYKQLMARNGITDPNSIQAGDQLKVRYNIMTRTPTIAPTSTLNLVTPQPSATSTP